LYNKLQLVDINDELSKQVFIIIINIKDYLTEHNDQQYMAKYILKYVSFFDEIINMRKQGILELDELTQDTIDDLIHIFNSFYQKLINNELDQCKAKLTVMNQHIKSERGN